MGGVGASGVCVYACACVRACIRRGFPQDYF